MASIIEISKFSSLDFGSRWQHHFEQQEIYTQVFAIDDIIRVQFSTSDIDNITINIISDSGSETIIPEEIGATADETPIYQFLIAVEESGRYEVQFSNDYEDIFTSSRFIILDDSELIDTVLLRYTHRMNDYDVVFTGESQLHFDFRFAGGSLFSETKFNVNSNNFRDQRESPRTLSAYPYKTETLTIGDNKGVPSWVAEKVNLIFCLSDILLDGEYHVRSEGSTPEISDTIDKYPLYIYKMEIEPRVSYNHSINMYPFVKSVLATEDYKIIITEDGYGIRL